MCIEETVPSSSRFHRDERADVRGLTTQNNRVSQLRIFGFTYDDGINIYGLLPRLYIHISFFAIPFYRQRKWDGAPGSPSLCLRLTWDTAILAWNIGMRLENS